MTEILGWLWGSYCEHPLMKGAVTCTPALLCLHHSAHSHGHSWREDKVQTNQHSSSGVLTMALLKIPAQNSLQSWPSSELPMTSMHTTRGQGRFKQYSYVRLHVSKGSIFQRAPSLPDVSRPQGTSIVSPPHHVLGNTSTHRVHLLCLEPPGLMRTSATGKGVFSLQS